MGVVARSIAQHFRATLRDHIRLRFPKLGWREFRIISVIQIGTYE